MTALLISLPLGSFLQRWLPDKRDGRLIFAALIAATTSVLSSPALAAPQVSQPTVTTVRAGASCARCTLQFESVAGSDTPSYTPRAVLYGAWAVDSRGHFFVPGDTPYQVAVLDSTGRLLSQFGKRGAGPGEVGRITDFRVGPGDSIWVFDARSTRFSLFGPLGEQYVRSVPSMRPLSAWNVLPTGDIVLGTRFGTSQVGGRTVYLLPADGTREIAIGSVRTPRPPSEPYGLAIAWSARHNGIWVAEQYSDVIERWDLSGDAQMILRLPLSLRAGRGAAVSGRRLPRIALLREDPDGLLWLWIERPNPDFRPPTRPLTLSELAQRSSTNPNPSSFWVIAVIDTRDGTVLLEHALEANPYMPLGSSLFVRPVETADGPALSFFRGRIVRPE